MSFGGLYFTNKGRALQAKAQTGVQLNFTRIAVGDGSLSGQAIDDLNALIHQVKSLDITKLKTMTGGKVAVGGILSNQDIVTGFYWRELGLFAQDPDLGEVLYCYGNAGALAEYIPSPEGAEILEKQINIITLVGNAANVTATIEQSLVYASAQDLLDHENLNASTSVKGHIQLATIEEAAIGTDTTKAVTAAGVKAVINAAIAALINSAPGALDTLDELAQALGDDPNFATTVLNAIAGKVSQDTFDALQQAFTTHVAETTTNAHLAKNIGVEDTAGHFTGSQLEAVLAELFTLANDGKTGWVTVVGSPLLNTDTFAQLKTKTQTIKNTIASNLTAKGQSSAGTEALATLAAKIGQIQQVSLSAGEELLAEDTTLVNVSAATPTKHLSRYTVNYDGTIRLKFLLNSPSGNTVYGRIYKNGAAIGTLRSHTSGTITTYTEDFSCVAGDYFDLYLHRDGTYSPQCRGFSAYGHLKNFVIKS